MNPILRKELKLGSRSIRFTISLMLYAGMIAAIALLSLHSMVNRYTYMEDRGMWYYLYNSGIMDFNILTNLFLGLAIGQAVMVCVIMPVLTAGSIAGERERQTLEILLTAPISSGRIVRGKLYAAMTNMLLYIIVSMPAIAITFIYGGVHFIYIPIIFFATMAVAFLCGAIGVWCSAMYKKTILSVIMTMCVEFLLVVGPIVFVAVVYWASYYSQLKMGNLSNPVTLGISPLVLLLDPAVSFGEVVSKAFTGESIIDNVVIGGINGQSSGLVGMLVPYWSFISMVIMILLGCFFIMLAARQLDKVYLKDKKIGKKKKDK